MNLYISCGFLVVGGMLLFRFWATALSRHLLALDTWRRVSAGLLIAAICLMLYAVSDPFWFEYTAGLVLLGVVFTLMALALIMFTYESHARRSLVVIIDHYRWFGIPLALLCWGLGLWLLGWSYIGDVAELGECASDDQLNVVCGIRNAEDLVITPDEAFFIVPEFGGIGPFNAAQAHAAGRLMLVDLKAQAAQPAAIRYAENTWGDGDCQRTDVMPLSPHGIDLIERGDGRYQLAVINHAPGETVEMFEVVAAAEVWHLIWRGCVQVPKVNYLNDISLASDGSFYASHMYPPEFSTVELLMAALFSHATGYVLRWDTINGFGQVPATDGGHPNGVVYDESQNILYVAHNFADRIDAVDMTQAAVVASVTLNSPDNLVLRDGALWATSWDHEIADMAVCEYKVPCALPFSVHQYMPKTLRKERRWRFNHAPLGLVTVAFALDGRVWLGGIRTDRLGYFDIEPSN
ncbi:MAG: hypothetical protein ACJ04O_01565 [Cellvibrionales bacterium]